MTALHIYQAMKDDPGLDREQFLWWIVEELGGDAGRIVKLEGGKTAGEIAGETLGDVEAEESIEEPVLEPAEP